MDGRKRRRKLSNVMSRKTYRPRSCVYSLANTIYCCDTSRVLLKKYHIHYHNRPSVKHVIVMNLFNRFNNCRLPQRALAHGTRNCTTLHKEHKPISEMSFVVITIFVCSQKPIRMTEHILATIHVSDNCQASRRLMLVMYREIW